MTDTIIQHVTAPAPRYLLRLHILQALFRRLAVRQGLRFLEIGPGSGDVACYLATLPGIVGGLVIDRSEKSVALLRRRLGNDSRIVVQQGDIMEVPDGEYDFVLSFEVLEHIEEDLAFMRHVRGRLRPQGLWFISVPAYMRKWQPQDVYSGHVRRYERDELRAKLHDAGFRVEFMRDYGFPLTSLMRPFRDRFYRADQDTRSMTQQTLDSGTEGRAFARMTPRMMALLLLPFRLLQWLFAGLRLGDGLVVVARRAD